MDFDAPTLGGAVKAVFLPQLPTSREYQLQDGFFPLSTQKLRSHRYRYYTYHI